MKRAVVLSVSVIAGLSACGGSSPGISKSMAEARARHDLVHAERKACHQPVHVTAIQCRPAGEDWACRVSLSNGVGGIVREPAPKHPQVTTIC